MAEVPVTMRVYWRDPFGRFMRETDEGAADAIQAASRQGAALAKGFATRRSGAMADSIHPIGSGMHGGWAADDSLPETEPQEFGAGPHEIPNSFGWGVTLEHPGNPAVHFMKRSFDIISAKLAAMVQARLP